LKWVNCIRYLKAKGSWDVNHGLHPRLRPVSSVTWRWPGIQSSHGYSSMCNSIDINNWWTPRHLIKQPDSTLTVSASVEQNEWTYFNIYRIKCLAGSTGLLASVRLFIKFPHVQLWYFHIYSWCMSVFHSSFIIPMGNVSNCEDWIKSQKVVELF